MRSNFRKTVENKRKKLIEKLIAYSVFKKDDKQLVEFSLKELEYEYTKFKLYSHPHSEFGSIRLIGNNK